MTLTDDELRIAVAEICGAKYYARKFDGKVFLTFEQPPTNQMQQVAKTEHRPFKLNSDIPKYLNSRDAIISAVLSRSEEEQAEIAKAVLQMQNFDKGYVLTYDSHCVVRYFNLAAVLTAPPRLIAEALVAVCKK